jgi:alpha galactosidase C-like protein
MKRDPEGGVAVLLANLGTAKATGYFSLSQLGLTASTASVYDIWAGSTHTVSRLAYTLGAGQTALLRVG